MLNGTSKEELMDVRRTGEVINEAVRIALTIGLALQQIAHDIGVGHPTLGKA